MAIETYICMTSMMMLDITIEVRENKALPLKGRTQTWLEHFWALLETFTFRFIVGNPQTWSQPLAYNHSKFFSFIYVFCTAIVTHSTAIYVNYAVIGQRSNQLVHDPKFMT